MEIIEKTFSTCNDFLKAVCKDIQNEKDVFIFRGSLDGKSIFMQDTNGHYYCDMCVDIDGLARELALCQEKNPDMWVMVKYNYSPEDDDVEKYIFVMKRM